MWRRLYDKKAQSTGEYAMVFAIILGAIVAMQTYVKRGMQGRVKDGTDYMQLNTSALGQTKQYDLSGYHESDYIATRASAEADTYTAGASSKTLSQDDTTRASGGYTKYDDATKY